MGSTTYGFEGSEEADEIVFVVLEDKRFAALKLSCRLFFMFLISL